MNSKTKKILLNTQEELDRQIEQVRMKRNEEDRKYIVSQIGKDLVQLLTPLLGMIASNSRMTKNEMMEILKQVKVESPQVKVEPAQIKIDAPKVPDIKVPQIEFPKNELIKAIKEAISKVRFPKIEVPKVEIPKEIKVANFEKILEGIEKIANTKLSLDLQKINRDNPLPVILYDQKGNYADLQKTIIASGGGVGRIVEIKKIDGAETVAGGTKTVAAAGTAEQLDTSTDPIRRVWVQALDTNTNAVVVGGKDVDETSASRKGVALWASQGQWFNVKSLSLLWVDVKTNGEGVNYFYES